MKSAVAKSGLVFSTRRLIPVGGGSLDNDALADLFEFPTRRLIPVGGGSYDNQQTSRGFWFPTRRLIPVGGEAATAPDCRARRTRFQQGDLSQSAGDLPFYPSQSALNVSNKATCPSRRGCYGCGDLCHEGAVVSNKATYPSRRGTGE